MKVPAVIFGSRKCTPAALAASAVYLLIWVSGCSGADGGAAGEPTAAVSSSVGASEAQSRVLADAKVTNSEYQQAFSEFQACATRSGGLVKVDSRDPVSGLIRYSVGSELGTSTSPILESIEGRCYHEYFDEVELVFQTRDPAVLAALAEEDARIYREEFRPCLVKNGVAAPAEIVRGSATYATLTSQAVELQNAGKC